MATLTASEPQTAYQTPLHVQVTGEFTEGYAEILTPKALDFLRELHIRFNPRRLALLKARDERQARIDAGELPNFLEETKNIRESEWTIAPLPQDLQDRRVEITGPVERKMVINALNSGAKIFMADFEDSNTPSWDNNMQGHINLRDAINRTISFTNENGKEYKLNPSVATLLVRPRGWHLNEKHITVNGEETSGGLCDFGLYFFHNYKQLMDNGTAPYFYLPKMESHLEARLWNDVFVYAQRYVGIPTKTIKATVLVETVLATFELNEILYELRDHSAGLNCGRWDYIFSYIKKLRNLGAAYVLPDRSKVTMASPFMANYAQLVVKTCHKRNAPAIGGMAAFIPIKNDEAANEAAMDKVRQDKIREVTIGHDGTWVAHPGLVPLAMAIFDEKMPTPNQISRQRDDFDCSAAQLLEAPKDTITEGGLRHNINVGILYIESWLRGNGAAAIYNLMEDAATAEISRTQVWQWIKNQSKLEDGRTVTYELYRQLLPEELEKIKAYVGEKAYRTGQFEQAVALFDTLVRSEDFIDFLTLPAYDMID
ncbi:MAG: malate synthase A [Saprospiraceae bacterium]|nr:malate synthase A [Saprospiraceae bacterium]